MRATPDDRPPEESFRFVLRRATRDDHAALDAHPAFAALADASIGVVGYGRLMATMHDFYSALDGVLLDACDRHAVGAAGYAYAPRTPILAGDLASLGMSLRPVVNPAAADVPASIVSAPTLGGMLYVLEGSMLGGAMLHRSTRIVLETHGPGGDAYWNWCREAGAARWAATCRLLDGLAVNAGARSEMIDAARQAFRLFSAWFAVWERSSESVADARAC